MNRISRLFLHAGHRRRILSVYTRPCWTSIDFPNTKGILREEDEPDIPMWELINGFRDLRDHTKLYFRELKGRFDEKSRRALPPEHEDILIQYSFKEPSALNKFQVTADSEHGMGFSKAYLDATKSGTALFHGNLDTTCPKDGRLERTGFAAMRSFRLYKAFFRKAYFTHWSRFTHLILKVRGDGRTYVVSLGCPGTFDIELADLFIYPLYTHGGPYWQYVKIPFSKFYLTVNGRIPERGQRPVLQYKELLTANHLISSVGIGLMDRIDGPFQLEIDWIGVYNDVTNFEEWAYESYNTPFPV